MLYYLLVPIMPRWDFAVLHPVPCLTVAILCVNVFRVIDRRAVQCSFWSINTWAL